MTAGKIILGIDLGTTYSAVAYVDEHGEARIIPNDQSQIITPSVVYFNSAENNILVGQSAKDQIGIDPANVVSFVKREMGKHKDEIEPRPFDFNGKRYAPEEISALILKKLKEDAENQFQGRTITDAIITVPAYFNDLEREATKQAGKMAGLNVLRVINEPTAAAIAYGLTQAARQSQRVFVFDLGGGTFDVTLLDIHNQNGQREIQVINTGGDHRLGGKDWDDRLIEYVSREFINQFGEDPANDPEAIAYLREQAENVKKSLSRKEQAVLFVRTNDNREKYSITRGQFEEMTADLMTRVEGFCTLILEEKDMSWKDIDTILLAGGSTRMPMVRTMLERISGKPVSDNLINPDECVALGAALQATITTIESGTSKVLPAVAQKLGSYKITDVLSHSLGSIAFDSRTRTDRVFHILKKGTSVPCQHTEQFATLEDYQDSVLFILTEGESENPDNVTHIQEALLPMAKPLPKGAPLEMTFLMSEDGMLTAMGRDVTSGESITVQVERKGNLTAEEVIQGRQHVQRVEVCS